MNRRDVKIKGRNYTLISKLSDGINEITINGAPVNNLRLNAKYNVYFALIRLPEGNFWLTVYRQQPRLCPANHGISEADFIDEIARHAFPLPIFVLYMSFLILANIAILAADIWINGRVSNIVYIPVAIVELFFLALVNTAPVWPRKKRRLMSLLAVGIVVMMGLFALLDFWYLSTP